MKKEAMNIRTEVKNFAVRNRSFTLVSFEALGKKFYGAIEDKYLKNGKLVAELNGHQLFADERLEMVIARVQDRVEIDYLVSQGMDRAEAVARVFDQMENLHLIKNIVNA